MAAEIMLKPSEARDHAARMRSSADNARDTFSAMRSDLNALTDSFRGQAQAAFESRYVDWDAGANQVLEALEGLAQWLDQAATTLESVDQEMGAGLQ
ncbi:MAG: WXG100 family type VII secretion target [Nitriliruptoraceae bacterium]|nr:WXG100 family type VII secretion target [Nitriliruptoraceae bacterium]